METITINRSRKEQAKLIIMALVMTIVSLASALAGGSRGYMRIVGAIGALCFGGALIYFIALLFRPRPVLVIDDKGITDHSSAVGFGFIPWDVVGAIAPAEYVNKRFISLELTDFDERVAALKAVKSTMHKANQALRYSQSVGHGQAFISLEETSSTLDDTLELLHRYQAQYGHPPEPAAELVAEPAPQEGAEAAP